MHAKIKLKLLSMRHKVWITLHLYIFVKTSHAVTAIKTQDEGKSHAVSHTDPWGNSHAILIHEKLLTTPYTAPLSSMGKL